MKLIPVSLFPLSKLGLINCLNLTNVPRLSSNIKGINKDKGLATGVSIKERKMQKFDR